MTQAERRLCEAFPQGRHVVVSPGSEPGADAAGGESWGPERTIRAEVLRDLLLGEVRPPALLSISGAKIIGQLNLDFMQISFPVQLVGCWFAAPVTAQWAQLRLLQLSGSILPGLDLDGSHIDGHLWLSRCRVRGLSAVHASVKGDVILDGAVLTRRGDEAEAAMVAHNLTVGGGLRARDITVDGGIVLRTGRITGNLTVDDAHLTGGPGPALHCTGIGLGSALLARNATVDGEIRLSGGTFAGPVNLHGATITHPGQVAVAAEHARLDELLCMTHTTVHGLTRLDAARIAGSLLLADARLDNPGDVALDAAAVQAGRVEAERLRADGTVNLRGAVISGQVNLAHADLSAPASTEPPTAPRAVALRASSCTIGELWLISSRIQGVLNLRRSQIGQLYLTPEAARAPIRMDGLTYTSLIPRLPADQRIRTLQADPDGYLPQPYQQLAASYLVVGDDAAARAVRLAGQRRRRATLPWRTRIWGHLLDVTVGYGYHPGRAARWLTLLTAVGAVVFGLHHPPPLKPGEAPNFNPLIYTLDLLLPIIDFGQEKAFKPEGVYQWLSYLLIASGWILATTVIAGLSRTLSRQ
ncbi:membrane-associated oxidoreductase [Saccharopolyspora elongata]|uniref:Membrane-associated oxidoreductase n=1 Tax=Saccharopolyspora elongata TaxID=2530387 RepID=A0A4R4Y7T6_9PSEU|nr:membrane-associated oxidoreductase [Saccharopolyspora elongata]TDD39102.1 membrane-associated oxidoreductase [Saccharopolyspora elongata]